MISRNLPASVGKKLDDVVDFGRKYPDGTLKEDHLVKIAGLPNGMALWPMLLDLEHQLRELLERTTEII